MHEARDREFDRRFGVETFPAEVQEELTIESGDRGHGEPYQPTAVWTFPQLLAPLPADLRDFVFVDFGSGRGRSLLLASRFPFKKVVGVEYARELDAAARENIARFPAEARRCADVESVCADARDFPIPDEKCVFYFFNPFGEEVLSAVLENIESSHSARPREMYFIYHFPLCRHVFERAGFLRRVERSWLPPRPWVPAPYPAVAYRTRD